MTRAATAFRALVSEPAVRAGHRHHRTTLWRYVTNGSLATLLTSPVIYSTLIPFILVDGWVTVYQAICFRAWDIRRVRRRDYIVVDRHRLAYLNALEKLNCLFCGYANGVIAYAREVASRTEQYWCPIRHGRRVREPHPRYRAFVPFGDPVGYHRRGASLRSALKK